MNYQETTNWLFNQLPMYQTQGATAYKKDLTNTIALCQLLNNPHHQFKTIHVGGTNGKGSTSHMLASVLQQAGYKVGLYTSPHLKDFRERIKINGVMVDEQTVVSFVRDYKPNFDKNLLVSIFICVDDFCKDVIKYIQKYYYIYIFIDGKYQYLNLLDKLGYIKKEKFDNNRYYFYQIKNELCK